MVRYGTIVAVSVVKSDRKFRTAVLFDPHVDQAAVPERYSNYHSKAVTNTIA